MFKERELPLWRVIIERLAFAMILLVLSRWMLYLFNTPVFVSGKSRLFRAFFFGMRFDWFTLSVFNIPFLVLIGLPIPFKYNKSYKKITDFAFIFCNALAIALNLIDVIYFRFLDRRMTSELLEFIQGQNDDQGGMLLNFAADFWYMILIFFVFLFLLIVLTRKTRLQKINNTLNIKWFSIHTLSFCLIFGLSYIGIRGGVQTVPINIIDAAKYVEIRNMPLALNTPFTIIKGACEESLERMDFFTDEEADIIYLPIHKNLKINRFIPTEVNIDKPNVIIIILEGIGQEMIGFYNDEMRISLTPFMDSIFSNSLTFNGMANGRRSIETLPSVLCGIPSLMQRDLPSSRYSTNKVDGFGLKLQKYGYKTAFFHGGNNGSMSFDATSMMCGFSKYYGRNEYADEKDYDGCWGIYDGPFMQFAAETVKTYEKPFAAAIYTLSSHHPFSLPDGYVTPLDDNFTPFEKTVRYTDDALRQFFDTLRKEEWFDNTIFVITADHVSPEHRYENYNTTLGRFKVPMAFCCPSLITPIRSDEMSQHTDIALSLSALICPDEPVFSFGRNVFDSTTTEHFIGFYNENFIYSDGKKTITTDGTQLTDTIAGAIIQQYTNRMIEDKLVY